MSHEGLSRKQHPGFGKELRKLISSTKPAENDLAGIVVSEINDLREKKGRGEPHRNESHLAGDLSDIGYLRLYGSGYSMRIYFTVQQKILWMVRLVVSKRRTQMTDGERQTLKQRLRVIKQAATP